MNLVRQTAPAIEGLGGTTRGVSVVLGVSLTPRLSTEFEALFVGPLEGGYTYSPNRTSRARVMTRRRDAFFTFQVRARIGVLEPVLGASYLRGAAGRRATIVETGRPYFDDRESQHALALAGGIDAAVKLMSHLFFVPTFRAFIAARPSPRGPLAEQTSGGRFAFRYGAGARVVF